MLIDSLPIDSLMPILKAKNVVTPEEEKIIQQKDGNSVKADHLLNKIVIPSLQANQQEKFDLFLEAMKEPKSLICQSLATELSAKLERSITRHPKIKPPHGKLCNNIMLQLVVYICLAC